LRRTAARADPCIGYNFAPQQITWSRDRVARRRWRDCRWPAQHRIIFYQGEIMKKLALAIAACAVIFSQAASAEEKKLKLEDLAWLSGCWTAKPGSPYHNYEVWTKAVGNMMLGIGAEVKDGKVTSHEAMRIEARDNGDLVFTAQPSGKDEKTFTLSSTNAHNLVFENPKSDFPQNVIYRREKDGSLEARVDGTVNGEKRAKLFAMVTTACQ
jgi:hypothetical protein